MKASAHHIALFGLCTVLGFVALAVSIQTTLQGSLIGKPSGSLSSAFAGMKSSFSSISSSNLFVAHPAKTFCTCYCGTSDAIAFDKPLCPTNPGLAGNTCPDTQYDFDIADEAACRNKEKQACAGYTRKVDADNNNLTKWAPWTGKLVSCLLQAKAL